MIKPLKGTFLLFCALFCNQIVSGQSITISGYIEDANSGERLPGVNVFISGKTMGTASNTYGFYSLSVPKGDYIINVSFVGYKTEQLRLSPKKDTTINWQMVEAVQELNEVEVVAEQSRPQQTQMSQIDIPVDQIKKLPAFLGEVDVLKIIQLLPGVQSGNEGTSGIYVRGGSPDQNLILMDGVPVYNVSHLFGFFSVFNADAVKSVRLTKGGFPARFGGRLSSVLEIDLKEGNMKEFHGEGSVGLIASKLMLEGPIWKDKTSFAISGRRTYIDLLTRPLQPANEFVGYHFGDLTAKVNHKFSERDRLYASFYTGVDKFRSEFKYNDGDESNAGLKWGNTTAALRWNHLFNPKLFANFAATYSKYQFEISTEEKYADESYSARYFSGIEDVAVKADFDYLLNTRHSFKFGASATYHTFTPGALAYKEDSPFQNVDSLLAFSPKTRSTEMFVYAEDEINFTDRLKANVGLHYAGYLVDNEYFHSLQPRLSARYLLTDELSAKVSYAYMTQFIHLLSNTTTGLPTDLWVPATAKIPPQQSQQVAAGLAKYFPALKLDVSLEGYYKVMTNLIEYKEGASFISRSDWQTQVETGGNGRAYGMEFLVQRKVGKLSGWVGYTLAWSKRQFDNLNNGEVYPYKYDRRHDVSVVLTYDITPRIDIGVTWVYGSGNTITMPLEYYIGPQGSSNFVNGYTVTRYSSRNGYRMPAYHRMDLGINFNKETRWGSRTINISIYNLYNHQNPFFLYIDEDYNTGEAQVWQISLFPIIPSISYIFRF